MYYSSRVLYQTYILRLVKNIFKEMNIKCFYNIVIFYQKNKYYFIYDHHKKCIS